MPFLSSFKQATPVYNEEWYITLQTVVADIPHPTDLHQYRSRQCSTSASICFGFNDLNCIF